VQGPDSLPAGGENDYFLQSFYDWHRHGPRLPLVVASTGKLEPEAVYVYDPQIKRLCNLSLPLRPGGTSAGQSAHVSFAMNRRRGQPLPLL